MIHFRLSFILLIIFLFVLTACSGKRNLEMLDRTGAALEVPMSFQSITFVDHREPVSDGIYVELPPDAKMKKINPSLTEEHKSEIQSVIVSNLASSGGEPYDLTVEILQASKQYDARKLSKSEEVVVKLRLTAAGHNIEVEAEAGGQYFYSALRGDAERHEEIYRTALRNSAYRAMEILQYYQSKSQE